MKEFGSKFAVLIIVLAMIILASILFEATNDPLRIDDDGSIKPIIYEAEMKKNELENSKLDFEEYISTEDIVFSEVAEVDFSTHPLAKNYEAIIEKNYKAIGANFANKYSIVSWSCGIDCQNSIIIDVESGRIVTFGIISAHGLSFSPTSRLLIINPADSISEVREASTTEATDYYLIDDEGELTMIAKEVNGENLLHECIKATTTARNILTNYIENYDSACKVPFGWEITTN